MLERFPRLFSFLLTITFLGLVYGYVREFPVLGNTIGIKSMVVYAFLIGFGIAIALIGIFRKRFIPLTIHYPEIIFIVVVSTIFMPLFASWINRATAETSDEPFFFVAEKAYVAAAYGLLKDDKKSANAYRLTVQENGRYFQFQYKAQAYFPLTKPGETILLPVKKGILGFRVVQLK